MLTMGSLDADHAAAIGEGEVAGVNLERMRDLINSHILGLPSVFTSVELVDTENPPGDRTTGLYITTKRWRAFVLLVAYRPTCRLDVVDTVERVDKAYNADWTSHALANDLSTISGARRLAAKTWSKEITADLRAEERTRGENLMAIANAAEDLTTWELIPDEVRIEACLWKFAEVSH